MRRDGPLLIALLALLYLLVGTLGHDPWRGDDASHFGPVFELLAGERWLVPAIGGEPMSGFGPLYYWVAAATATLLKPFLPLHEGARLASALLAAAALWSLWRGTALIHGEQARHSAVLLTLGSLGLVVHVHEIQPALGLLAAQAWVLHLLVLPRPWARPLAGVAAAAAALFAGLQGVLITWPLLLLHAGPRHLAPRAAARIAAVLIALALTLAWALPACAAAGWNAWFAAELAALQPEAPEPERVLGWLKLFGWFLWPLWPLALWSVWRRHRGAGIQGLPLLLAALGLSLLAVVLTGGLRPVRMLPLIVPLALLAAPAVERLRRGAAAAFDWFAVTTFTIAGLLLWLGWSALVLRWPPGLARHYQKLAPDFELSPGLPALALGAGLVAAWLLYLWWRRAGGRDAALTWAAGMTMTWCIATSMLEPWFEHTRSYRSAAQALAIAAGGRTDCVSGVGLGPAQRSAMHYFGGIRVRPNSEQPACPLVLVYADARMNPRELSRYGSTTLWRYERGGGRQRESFTLLAAP